MIGPFNIVFIVEDSQTLAAYQSIRDAVEGDRKRIAQRVRDGAKLRADERAFVADFLLGRVKQPRNRPPQRSTSAKQDEVAVNVHVYEQLHDCKREAAIEAMMNRFKVSRRYVFDALRAKKEDPVQGPHVEQFAAGVVAMLRRPKENRSELPTIRVPWPTPGPIYPPSADG